MSDLSPISCRSLAKGLYLIRQFQAQKGVEHSGILDVGNCAGLVPSMFASEPLVIHLPASGYAVQPFGETGTWSFVRRLGDQAGAVKRLRALHVDPGEYSAVTNNCEHFTAKVETGAPSSPQLVERILVAASLIALVWIAAKAAD
jgi:hypothetical protein